MLRDFYLGVIKIHILYHASQGPVYGLELIEELGSRRIREMHQLAKGISPGNGDIMPQNILHSLHLIARLSLEEHLPGDICKDKSQFWPGRTQGVHRITSRGAGRFQAAFRTPDH